MWNNKKTINKDIPVNCINCTSVLFKIREGLSVNLTIKCGKCGTEQRVNSVYSSDVKIDKVK